MLKQPIPVESREHYSVRQAAGNAVLAHELPYDLPPPPYGLPGENRNPDHAVMDMLQIGLEYLKAVANGEVRRQWNTYNEMNVEMSKLLRAGEAAQLDRIMEMDRRRDEERQAALIAESKRKGGARVYFLGSEDGPVKIGMAIDIGKRLKTLQTSHHCKLTLLAQCGGGREQEQAYHKRFAEHRLAGEWFRRCPEIESEIARLGGGE